MKVTALDHQLAREAMTDDERKQLADLERQLADGRAEYRPLLQVEVERVDGKDYSKCLCGWLAPHGSTRCGNAAHWGNVQRAWEDQITKVTMRADRAEDESARLRGVIREAVGKLTNLHCKTKRDQSRLCMAFDVLHPEQG